MKLKLFVFLLFISISVSGQINGSAGYFNYLEPTRGFEVNIEIKYNLREAFGEVALTASFETSPARGGFRYYFYNGKRYNLVDYGIYAIQEHVAKPTGQ